MESQVRRPKRFGWVTEGKPQGPDALCDVPVMTSSLATALPTIGAIVPNWILVVPRQCALSLAALPVVDRKAVVDLAEQVALRLGSSDNTVFFEHGPRSGGSAVGCGVDQAHLHVLSTNVDFVKSALSDSAVVWSVASADDPWGMSESDEYYFLRSRLGTFVGRPNVASSQFFRKHIALAAGVPEQWDYNHWPNYANVRRTYERFNRSAAENTIG
jgi:ATP adenylyltransferase